MQEKIIIGVTYNDETNTSNDDFWDEAGSNQDGAARART